MPTFQNQEDLREYLSDLLKKNICKVISIDGKDGSGKSTIGGYLCQSLEMIRVSLDDDRYLKKNRGGFIDFIRYDVLISDLKGFEQHEQKVIIEGICILKILDKLGIKPELTIYVKRLVSGGFWMDGQKFDYSQDVEAVLKRDQENLKSLNDFEAMIEGKGTQISKSEESTSHEILRYHYEYQPNLNADIIFENPT